MKRPWLFTLTILSTLLMGSWAEAQRDYPTRPIKLVIGYPAGGLVDTTARVIGERLTQLLGQQIIVESRAGANGSVATGTVAKADPDGYTLLLVLEGHAINPSLFDKLPYDSVRDFAPIGFIGKSSMILAVPSSFSARSLSEYIKLAKETPDGLTYGSIGFGSASHLASEAFRAHAGIKIRHVPFRGGAPALNDLVAGHISSMLITPVVGQPHFKSGALVPLAVAAPERLELLPELPTMAESGLPLEAAYWFGLLAPAATPQPIRQKLEAVLAETLATQQVRNRLTELGAVVAPMSSADFQAFIDSEIDRWSKFVKENDIKMQ